MTGSRRGSQKRDAGRGAPKATSDVGSLPLRPSGVSVAPEMPWGSHLCLFYESPDDLLDANTAYIKAGLDGNEYCIWAVSGPITEQEAWAALRRDVPDLDRATGQGQLELLQGHDWYLPGGEFDSRRITRGWHEKLQYALDKGFEGLRISGNAFWFEHNRWKEFREYEFELDETLHDRPMLVLCTYSLRASRAVDVLDVARAHQFTIARRHGEWEFLETPELKQARRQIENLNAALLVLSRRFAGHQLLTARERTVLAQIVRGASSKEAARSLDISPRTVEFHRANILQKLGARNAAELVRIVVESIGRDEADE